jgi:hypothetical protein
MKRRGVLEPPTFTAIVKPACSAFTWEKPKTFEFESFISLTNYIEVPDKFAEAYSFRSCPIMPSLVLAHTSSLKTFAFATVVSSFKDVKGNFKPYD